MYTQFHLKLHYASISDIGYFSLVIPTVYTFPIPTAVNGSSITGKCALIIVDSSRPRTFTCILTQPLVFCLMILEGCLYSHGLDGDMWASQLLTIQTTASSTDIIFDFRNAPSFVRVERVEVVMFNCQQWGIGVQTIKAFEQDAMGFSVDVDPTVNSCNSLVRLCLPYRTSLSVFTLQFFLFPNTDKVYLAETTFFGNNYSCPPDIVITSQFLPPVTSTSQELLPTVENITLPHTTLTPNTPKVITEPRSMDTTVITLVIVVVFILFLLLVGVVVVVLVLWRCRHQHTAKEEASHTSSQTHQPINLQEIGHIHEEHTQVNDGVVSGSSVDEPEYSVVATNPSPDSNKPIKSGTPPDHLYEQVDEKRKKKVYTQQEAQSFKDKNHLYDEVNKQKALSDTGVVQFSRGQQKPSSSPKTTQSDSHDVNELQEHHLCAQIGTPTGDGDTGEGGVAVSDPTYMEVGAAEGKTFELKQNVAYALHTTHAESN